MLRLFLIVVLFLLACSLARSALRILAGSRSSLPREKTSRGEDMVRDLQCGIFLPRDQAVECTIGGETRFFCSETCRDAFLAGR